MSRASTKRMGHSVEILVSKYVGALDGGEGLANERIELALAGVQSVDNS